MLPVQAEIIAKSTFVWGFGDGSKLATGAKQTHSFTFAPYVSSNFPTLRLTEENGISMEAFVQLTLEDPGNPATNPASKSPFVKNNIPLIF